MTSSIETTNHDWPSGRGISGRPAHILEVSRVRFDKPASRFP